MVELAVKHDGTADNPYEIHSAEDLKQLAEDVNAGNDFEGKFFVLTADIELSGNWTPIGYLNSSDDQKPFNGTFDGQDHTISNLTINNPSSKYQGLFGCVYGGTIKNVNLTNVNINGNEKVGGLVGYNVGTVENCTVSDAEISGNDCVGGLVGSNEGTVKNCKVSDATVSGPEKVGGLVGFNWSGDTVENCTVSNATVSGNDCVGGLVGLNDGYGTVENCTVSDATVSGEKNIGGFVGSNSVDYIFDDEDGNEENNGVVNDGVINGTNYYHGNQPEAVGRNEGEIAGTVTRVYSIKFPEGVTVDGAIEIGGKTFFASGATLTVSNFTGGEIVFDDDLPSSVMPKLQFTS